MRRKYEPYFSRRPALLAGLEYIYLQPRLHLSQEQFYFREWLRGWNCAYLKNQERRYASILR